MFNPYLDSALVILIYVTTWFLLAMLKKDNSIVDIAWGLGFVAVALYQFYVYPHAHSLLLTTMVLLWGARLGIYLFIRNWQEGEDWRYQKMRENWKGNFVITSYFRVFILQGTLMWIIAMVLMQQPRPETTWLPILKVIGFIIFLTGFLWEAIADYQLQQFKSNPANKGKFMKSGLWKYSRHPNYFGEILVWWGIFVYSLAYGHWYFIISPVMITFLLLRVSGVPFLERKQQKDARFKEYTQKVPNAILPKFW